MGFLRRIFGRDVKTDTTVQNGYTLVADDTKTSGLDWSDVLLRGGLGRDLNAGINSIDATSIDTTLTPGEYHYTTNTTGDTPSDDGLVKVWRESSSIVYQLAQSSTNKLFSRYYDGSWTPWKEYADTIKSNLQSIPLAPTNLRTYTTAGTYDDTTTISVPTIPVRGVARVLLIGGGGGGGTLTIENGAAVSQATRGGDTKLYVYDSTQWVLAATSGGGLPGPGGHWSNGSAYYTPPRPQQSRGRINNTSICSLINYRAYDPYIASVSGDYKSHVALGQEFHPYVGDIIPSTAGLGGAGKASGEAGVSAAGADGYCMEVEVKNYTNAPLKLKVEVGNKGLGGTGAGAYFVNGDNGNVGAVVVIV